MPDDLNLKLRAQGQCPHDYAQRDLDRGLWTVLILDMGFERLGKRPLFERWRKLVPHVDFSMARELMYEWIMSAMAEQTARAGREKVKCCYH